MALSGAKYQEATMGQYGSSFLFGDGDIVDLSGASATRYICAITLLDDTVFQELQTLGGEIGSISTLTPENDHDHSTNGFGAAGNATDLIKGGSGTTHVFPKGVTIFGRWDYAELHSGSCVCYFAPV